MKTLNVVGIGLTLLWSPLGAGHNPSPAELPSWFPRAALNSAIGWEANASGVGPNRVRVTCQERKIRLTISVEQTELTSLPPVIRQGVEVGGTDFTTGTLELPIGSENRFDRKNGRWRDLHVFTSGSLVRAFLNVSRQLPGGEVGPSSENHAGDEAIQDGILRGVVARLAGASAGEVRTVDYHGTQIETVKVSGNGLAVYQVGQTTAALGITATMDYSSYVLTLKRGDRTVVLPLGTKRINVNGTVRDLSDVSAEVGDKPFVQGEALDALF